MTANAPDAHVGAAHSFSFIAPRHPDGANWPWLSQISPMRRHSFTPVYIENTFPPFKKATGLYVQWQYLRAARIASRTELVFTFGVDINIGMSSWPARVVRQPKRIYVGFTQDGRWSAKKIDRISRALQKCDAITVFSNDERDLYLARYRLDPRRVHLISIHTDETQEYRQYPDARLRAESYVLSLGSPNRRFMPVARACHALHIPLVIITRPWHKNDSLDELANLGASIITDADKMKSLAYLKHAKMAVMAFEAPELPGAFTTIIHASFMNTPCVVTSCLGISDYVVNDETGLIVPHGDEMALRGAVDRLWNEPGLAERFGQAAHTRAERLYSLQAAAKAFDELAMRVLAE